MKAISLQKVKHNVQLASDKFSPSHDSRSNSPTLIRSANLSIAMFRPLSKISAQSREYQRQNVTLALVH